MLVLIKRKLVILDIGDFNVKGIFRDKRGYFLMINDIIILNL